MARALRIMGEGLHYHIILRVNNGEFLLGNEDFWALYLLLVRLKREMEFKVYNYAFMHSHIHLMMSTHGLYLIDKVMHRICLNFSRRFNGRHGRSGHLWKNRYRSRLILNDLHGLACLRYQHRNADKAGIVSSPEQWKWSGYHFYALGKEDPLLTPHPSYLGLAEDEKIRCDRYQKFVATPLTAEECRIFEMRSYGRSQRMEAEVLKIIGPLYQNVSASW